MTPAKPTGGSAIGQALLVLGDRWTLLILVRAFVFHTRRFGDWRDELGLSESTLAARLRDMVQAGLLQRTPYNDGDGERTRDEYRLTERALELWNFLLAIWGWEQSSIPEFGATLLHDECGSATRPILGCGNCGQRPITARSTVAERGATAEFSNIAVPRLHRRTRESSTPGGLVSFYPETMAILGDRWSPPILAAAFLRIKKFSVFKKELGIAPSVLSDRLRRFVAAGVLTSDASDGEYRLTPKGIDFFPVYATIVDWAQRWYSQDGERELTIRHVECGAQLKPVLLCEVCGHRLERTSVHFHDRQQ